MGRVRLKKALSSKNTSDENTKHIDSSKSKKRNQNLRQLKENSNCGVRNSLRLIAKDCNRSILSDKTGSTLNQLNYNETNILTDILNNSKVVEDKPLKTKTCHKKITFNVPASKEKISVSSGFNDNVLSNKENTHLVPIYKQNRKSSLKSKKNVLSPAKKLALYEFDEIDSEVPVLVKKKGKKRNYNCKQKYKTGPKCLTINNIKYSSSESIHSIKEPPVYKKPAIPVLCNRNKKNAVKRQSQSMISLNETQSSCVSVASFKSQPVLESSFLKNQLSVINESGTSHLEENISSQEHLGLLNSRTNNYENPCDTSIVNAQVQSENPNSSMADNQSFSHFYNANDTFLLEQVNQSNTEDVCSSTPCKARPVQHSYSDDLPRYVGRIETESGDEFHGFEDIEDLNEQTENDLDFGFKEDEGVEEPLLSPIKKPGAVSKTNKVPEVTAVPVLSVREIVQMLQSEQKPEESVSTVTETVTNISSPEESTTVVQTLEDAAVSFTKPPRRSYERPVRRCYFIEKDYGSSEDEEVTIKVTKPRPKRKQKAKGSKEEAEANKLAEMLNSKFQEVDKFSLCVE